MSRLDKIKLIALAAAALAIVMACAVNTKAATVTPKEPAVPALTGRVVDAAGVLSSSAKSEVTNILVRAEAGSGGRQIMVLLPKDLGGFTSEEYAMTAYSTYKLGKKGADNGVLLLIAPKERKVWIVTGYGMEETLPDATARLIVHRDIAPTVRNGGQDWGAAAKAGVLAIIKATTEKTK